MSEGEGDGDGEFPYILGRICTAASLGDLGKVREEVEANPDVVFGADYDMRAPLHIAAANGQLEVARYLLERGVNVNALDRWGATPLRDALRHGDERMLELLRAHGANTGSRSTLAVRMCQAGSCGDVGTIARLLKEGAVVNDKDYDGRAALHLAAAKGHLDTVRFLLDHGADLEITDNLGGTPLGDAVRHQQDAVADLLRAKGAVLHDVSSAQLFELVLQRDLAALELMVANGADVTAVDYDSRSALHVAASCGDLPMVKYLVEHGAIVEAQDRWGSTALGDAIHHGHHEVALFLRSKGAVNESQSNAESRPAFVRGSREVPETFAELLKLDLSVLAEKGRAHYGYLGTAQRVLQAMHKKMAWMEDGRSAGREQQATLMLCGKQMVHLVVQWLVDHTADDVVMVHGMHVLLALACMHVLAVPISNAGGLRVAVEALGHTDREVVVCAAAALSHLTAQDVADMERMCVSIVRENAVAQLIQCIKTYDGDARLCDHAITVLIHLMAFDPSNAARIANAKGLQAICVAWRVHEADRDLVRAAAHAVELLLSIPAEQKDFFESGHGQALALSSLKKYKKDPDLCASILGLLSQTVGSNAPAFAQAMVSSKGFSLVVGVIKAYPENLPIQERGAQVLSISVHGLPKSARASHLLQLKRLGADKLLMQAHRKFPESAVIARVNNKNQKAASSGCCVC